MRLSRRDFGFGLAGATALSPLAALARGKADVAANSAALTTYLDTEFEKELMMNPERLTAVGRKERYGELQDRSEADADKALAWRRKSIADMKARFDPADLSEDA